MEFENSDASTLVLSKFRERPTEQLPTTHGLKYKRLITRYTARKTGQCRVGPGPGVGARRWCGTGAAVPAPVPPAGIVLVARLRSECTLPTLRIDPEVRFLSLLTQTGVVGRPSFWIHTQSLRLV